MGSLPICPAGFTGAGPFQVAIFAWALMGFSATYLGAAKRAFDLTVEAMPQRRSMAMSADMAHHPEVQHNVADMRIAYDAAEALLWRLVGFTGSLDDGIQELIKGYRLLRRPPLKNA